MPAIKIEMSNKWKIETAVSVKNIVMNAVKKYTFFKVIRQKHPCSPL